MYLPLTPENSLLAVIDVQERLMPVMLQQEQLIFNVRRLLEAAQHIAVPAVLSEQYPQGLGTTVKELQPYIAEETAVLPKKSFSIYDDVRIRTELEKYHRSHIVLCGVETHVCVLQSAFDLLKTGYRVYIVTDAVGSRFVDDQKTALRRFETASMILTTTESLLFEWCRTAEHPQFKMFSRLAKERLS